MSVDSPEKIVLFWYRRDLRLEDNHALHLALKSGYPVLPIFIFDSDITDELPKDDARLTFIFNSLLSIDNELKKHNSSLKCLQGKPAEVWHKLTTEFDIKAVYTNVDYEPYAIKRDQEISDFLSTKDINFIAVKDHVIFEKNEVLKDDGKPYTVYTPFKNKWLKRFQNHQIEDFNVNHWNNYLRTTIDFPTIKDLGFEKSIIKVSSYDINNLENYEKTRNFPELDATSKLGPHLRFGTVSIRKMVTHSKSNAVFLSELIWREFFIQIMYHFPHVITNNFKPKYDTIEWRNNSEEFEKWKKGETGYPIVDAGMRELNTTGHMHNRVRMITAGFLCKHLLIDWRWGEAYFAEKLLDYELASNNGNWQWSAGTGCDAAPYFRVFNPTEQIKKFDKELNYIRKWITEFDSLEYPTPMVEHKFARNRALETYKRGLN